MQAVTLLKYDTDAPVLELREKEPNPLKPGEVRVRIHASPINPSDIMFLRGLYGFKKKTPVTAGFEGSGTILEVGEGITNLRPGDRVACVAGFQDGTWAEELITTPENCLKLLDSVTLEEGATFTVNPMTAWAMVEQGVREGHKGFVQTAGASALGKMVLRLCQEKSIPLINIVRKPEQAEELKKLGAELVLLSGEPNFPKELYRMSKKWNTTYVLDAVAGEVATQILECSPYGTKMICYGALSEKPIQVNSGIILFQNKKIEGFWLSTWIAALGLEEFQNQANQAQQYAKTIFATRISKKFPLSQFQEGLDFYKANMSLGKVIFTP